ncbi:MAG: acylphosphatase [Candidatus Woesearchaeota archaeon]
MKTLRIIIKGRVQGVGFRFFARQKAQLYGIKGFARNLSDGSLEIIAQSSDDKKLESFLKECKRGPLLASVEDFKFEEIVPDKEYSFFDIK